MLEVEAFMNKQQLEAQKLFKASWA